MNVIEKILSHQDFELAPPVLIDIGASGELHAKWKEIARYSICIAFDADNREMGFTEKETDTFRKLIVFSKVVTDREENEIDFFLTKSPFCSSSLEPDIEKLKDWAFREHFNVEQKIRLKAIRLAAALQEAKIDRIDWLKTDTQGTDLRLFESLPDEIRNKVIMAEFEPGIIDAYEGEDKLHEVMNYMDQQGYFMSTLDVKSTIRINPAVLNKFSTFHKRAVNKCLIKSPGWAEVSYLNTLKSGTFERRTYLLTYLFACLEKQFGFAIEIAKDGYDKTKDSFFLELKESSINKIKSNNLGWPRVMIKKAGNKLLSYL